MSNAEEIENEATEIQTGNEEAENEEKTKETLSDDKISAKEDSDLEHETMTNTYDDGYEPDEGEDIDPDLVENEGDRFNQEEELVGQDGGEETIQHRDMKEENAAEDEGEEHLYEGDEEGDEEDWHEKKEKSIEIEIPDLYGDDADSLPDLGDDTYKKEREEVEPEVLDINALQSNDELEEGGGEEGFGSEEFSGAEEYGYLEGEEEAYYERPVRDRVPKRVEIGGPDFPSSESDIFLQLLEKEDTAEAIKEKEKAKRVKKEDPVKASGVPELLTWLMTEVIKRSEEIDPEAVLRVKLDRHKLMIAFKICIADTQQERQKRYFLNKKVVEYFRRKKYSRALAEDNPETIVDTMKRYRECLLRLDSVKAREHFLQLQIKTKQEEVQRQEKELRADAEMKIEALNKRLKEIGINTASVKTGQPMPERYVDMIIKKMNLLRDQISELRLTFIRAQHKMASLITQAKKLEDIGDGLKVIDFEQLRAETQGLGDKVEERNNELSKLRERCTADTHFLAHIREKQYMLNHTISVKDSVLHELKDELNANRNYVNKLKLQRDSIRKKYNEMSYECGLLDKPNLLHDFDDTVEQTKAVQIRLDSLKEVRAKMLKELGRISQELDRKS